MGRVQMLKPARLHSGDLIGVVAPAAAVEAAAVHAGVEVLEGAGYRVRVGDSVYKRAGYLAGTDADRVADLVEMFGDPEVRAVVAARGGYGAGRLLPLFDLRVVRKHPKIFVGYSDVTFLLSHFVQQGELVTFHGPMVVGMDQHRERTAFLLSLLSGDPTGWNLSGDAIVQPGTGEGVIVGGCLSVVAATLGTPYELETGARLLFLEDVNEKPYSVDRMLTQLRQAGKLEGVAGVMFGEMRGCAAHPHEAVTVREVIAEQFATASYPVVFGMPTGHGGGAATLPLGVRARLAGERLTLLESPLAE